MRKADNLITFMCLLSRHSGSLNLLGLSRPTFTGQKRMRQVVIQGDYSSIANWTKIPVIFRVTAAIFHGISKCVTIYSKISHRTLVRKHCFRPLSSLILECLTVGVVKILNINFFKMIKLPQENYLQFRAIHMCNNVKTYQYNYNITIKSIN
jgi:hypothetical protein